MELLVGGPRYKLERITGSIPDIIRIFHWLNLSGRTMALGSIQPLTEMNARDIVWRVKAASAKTYHIHVPIVWKSGAFKLLEPSGPGQVCTGIAWASLFNYH
jgi:hypothetical protein